MVCLVYYLSILCLPGEKATCEFSKNARNDELSSCTLKYNNNKVDWINGNYFLQKTLLLVQLGL